MRCGEGASRKGKKPNQGVALRNGERKERRAKSEERAMVCHAMCGDSTLTKASPLTPSLASATLSKAAPRPLTGDSSPGRGCPSAHAHATATATTNLPEAR